MQRLMSLMFCGLTNWTNESFVLTMRINADKVENLALMKITFLAFQITYFNLFELFWIDTHYFLNYKRFG